MDIQQRSLELMQKAKNDYTNALNYEKGFGDILNRNREYVYRYIDYLSDNNISYGICNSIAYNCNEKYKYDYILNKMSFIFEITIDSYWFYTPVYIAIVINNESLSDIKVINQIKRSAILPRLTVISRLILELKHKTN